MILNLIYVYKSKYYIIIKDEFKKNTRTIY